MNCNKLWRRSTFLLFGVLSLSSAMVYGQEKPYKEGSVWYIEMIRVKAGMFDVYMRDVLPLRAKIEEAAKKQGLILSSHVLSGPATGRDDFDVMFLTEYKNWATFDGLEAKYEAILSNVIGSEEKRVQMMTKRAEEREIKGEKAMQELSGAGASANLQRPPQFHVAPFL
ncbi:MAG TPA: hypothetical protein VG425_18965 [Casimicrobiaceae bacterium]|nr:hypothetical protein [Casimicrobiaceae bacterium]